MRPRPFLTLIAVGMAAITFPDITIMLKNDFIETYRSRFSIQGSFKIDKALAKPNPGSEDGDLHVAGRSDSFGLATVAEIMNARDSNVAVESVHQHEGKGPVDLIGVWRIWCEHGGNTTHVQGNLLKPFITTNPDHVFEVHPILKLGGIDLTNTLHTIPGFNERGAHQPAIIAECTSHSSQTGK